MQIRTLVLAAGLALSGAVGAQSLPKPGEFYFDTDAAARPVVVVKAEDPVPRLQKIVDRDPNARPEAAQLGHLAFTKGQRDVGESFYEHALGGLDASSALWRPVMWNYAWDLYRSGDHEAALQRWSAVVSARSTKASWVPPTLALALWTTGHKDEAVRWYAAAVRTEPLQWTRPEALPALLPEWREEDRAALAEVQAAWAANPPTWP